jgi:RNA polymerase sigma-70 factor (sigma-E family)
VEELPERGASLDAFVREHALSLTRFAYLLTGDRGSSEDLVQEVLFAMHRRFGVWLDVEDPLRYARRSIVNAHISRLRRRRVSELLSDKLPEVPSWDAREANDMDDAVWAALHRLPDRQRAVLVLRYYLGTSDRDIAGVLRCRESSVRSMAARAFKTLRPMLRSGDEVMDRAQ